METLKFLSFGTWNTLVTENELTMAVSFFWIALVAIVLKLIGNIRMDVTKPYNVNTYISYIARILNVLFYLLLISLTSLFGNVSALIIIESFIFFYILILGVWCLTSYDCSEYFGIENIIIVNLEQNIEESIEKNKKRKEKINDINYRIYEYKKRTVIG